jgi:hypothetical protein
LDLKRFLFLDVQARNMALMAADGNGSDDDSKDVPHPPKRSRITIQPLDLSDDEMALAATLGDVNPVATANTTSTKNVEEEDNASNSGDINTDIHLEQNVGAQNWGDWDMADIGVRSIFLFLFICY